MLKVANRPHKLTCLVLAIPLREANEQWKHQKGTEEVFSLRKCAKIFLQIIPLKIGQQIIFIYRSNGVRSTTTAHLSRYGLGLLEGMS